MAISELIFFIVVSALLVYGYLKKIDRKYLVFAALIFLFPASSGTFTAIPRYSIVAFPIYLALALIPNKLIKILIGLISVISFTILMILFARGYYIA